MKFDVLLSEIHKGKSIILKVSAVELRDLPKQRTGKSCAVNAVLSEGCTATEIKLKCHATRGRDQDEVFITETEDRISEDEQRLHKPACADIRPIHLTAGNNKSFNE